MISFSDNRDRNSANLHRNSVFQVKMRILNTCGNNLMNVTKQNQSEVGYIDFKMGQTKDKIPVVFSILQLLISLKQILMWFSEICSCENGNTAI